ncbi:MAG: hypothetical protein E4H02_11740 [Lentisphaerales bacterium]|nr:MAG: hypothetical protein E4H02_11740 [Lentisphaerales bacterium]
MPRNTLLVTAVLTIAVAAAMPTNARARKSKAGNNLRYSITVSKFENKAGWHGRWDIGDGWGAVLTDALQESDRFIVLGEKDMRVESMVEQDLATAGRTAKGKKTPKTRQMTPAQLLVKGTITHIQKSTTGGSGGISIMGIRLSGSSDKAEITTTIYLVDAQTGQVKASKSITGKAGRKSLGVGYYGSKLGGLTGNLKGFSEDNLGKATIDAVNQAVAFLVDELDDVPWEGTVMVAKGDKIIINRGSREGVEEGQKFNVGVCEELIDPDTGEVLDYDVTVVGTIEAKEVKEKITTCSVIKGGDAIEKGMTVQPAN